MRKLYLLMIALMVSGVVKAQDDSPGTSGLNEMIIDNTKPADRESNLNKLAKLDEYTKVEVLKFININDTAEIDAAMRKVKNLRKLRVLEFHNVTFTRFPSGIDECRDLESIVIDRCPIERLSKEIGGLSILANLQVTNSALKAIPKELGDCPSLAVVNLSSDSIRFLPADISTLYRLEKFNVANNKLTRLPEEIGRMKSLEELDLTGCRFRVADKELMKLAPIKHMTTLILKDCDLVDVPKVIQNFQKLETLVLDDNIIEDIPDFLLTLPALKTLSVKNCRIKPEKLAEIRSKLPNVEVIGSGYVYK